MYGANMRTINENLRDRMVAEAEEAETQGLIKVAENLTQQLEKHPVRTDDESYTYSNEKFAEDIESSLWDVVIRTADFHGKHVDAIQAQKIVESVAAEMVRDLRNVLGIPHGVGAFEPSTLGEVKETVTISVEDDD